MFQTMAKPSGKAGLSPGLPVHVGRRKTESVRVSLLKYGQESLGAFEFKSIEEIFPHLEGDGVTWVNIDGLHETDTISRLNERLGLHPLVTEDILDTTQRPKADQFDDYLFILLKLVMFDEDAGEFASDQISIVLKPGLVVTYNERSTDLYEILYRRLQNQEGRIRRMGADYLAYALMDAAIDRYFVLLETIEAQLDDLNDDFMKEPGRDLLQSIHDNRGGLIFLRKSLAPVRDIAAGLLRGESSLIGDNIFIYLKDLHDHTAQALDSIASLRDTATSLLEVYLSMASNRMNQVMKVLTIIATLFIPMTFIAGIYGMNFKYMPELDWRWGYPAVLLSMVAFAGGLLAYLRWKKWF